MRPAVKGAKARLRVLARASLVSWLVGHARRKSDKKKDLIMTVSEPTRVEDIYLSTAILV